MSEENVELARACGCRTESRGLRCGVSRRIPRCRDRPVRGRRTRPGCLLPRSFRRVTEEFTKSWESVRYGVDDYIDAGEHVVTPFTNLLRGRDGIEVQAPRHLALDYPGRRNCADLPLSGAARGTRRCWTKQVTSSFRFGREAPLCMESSGLSNPGPSPPHGNQVIPRAPASRAFEPH